MFMCVHFSMHANPIATPMVIFSELYFDGNGDWFLELNYSAIDQDAFPVNSMVLRSMTDTVTIHNLPFDGESGVFVLSKGSFSEKFEIRPQGDKISIEADYVNEWEWAFGDVENAICDAPSLGQSLCFFNRNPVKDSSPTLGEEDPGEDIYGRITGIIYDVNNTPDP